MLFMFVAGVNGIETLFQLAQQLVHFIRRCLSVIIQTHHVIAVGVTKSRHQCRMLSEIPGKADSLDIVIFITQIPYGSHGIVRGSIVHQKNIVFILREFLHFFPDLLHHMG